MQLKNRLTYQESKCIAKQLVAGFLFMLMLTIAVNQFFHHHEKVRSSKNNSGLQAVDVHSACSICDYYINRVVDEIFLSTLILVFLIEKCRSVSITFCISQTIDRWFFCLINKGPPILLG